MKIYSFLFGIAFLTLVSCDEVFDYNFNVKNLTNQEITVIFHTGNEMQNYWDSIAIKPISQKTFYTVHTAGGRELRGVDIDIVFESFIVRMGTIKSKVNYRNNNEWEFNASTKNIGEYNLTVDITHFQ
jgi:hypothetical protein